MQLHSGMDVEDFLRGANFLSASGGGDPVAERELLLDDLQRGLEVGWEPLNPDPGNLTCTVIFSGTIAPEAFQEPAEGPSLAPGERIRRPLPEAVRDLEREVGRSIDQVISMEIGGINTGQSLDAAVNLGKPLVDGDYAGRAIPELNATTPHIYGADFFPWTIVDRFGNRIVIRSAATDVFGERIGKFIARASFGLVACALLAIPGDHAARMLVPGTITECLDLGRAIRLAREGGRDPVQAAAETVQGWILFRGTITKREWKDTGYMEGFHEIMGEGEHEDHRLRIWFKNENHLSWLDGKPYVSSPDLMEVVDGESGEPLVNTYLEEGMRVAVVGRRRREAFDSEKGLATLGPQHFGWADFPFTPIEELVNAAQS